VQYEEFLDRSSGAEVSRDDAESLTHAFGNAAAA
jgi:hypothetical protein